MASSVLTCEKRSIAGRERKLSRMPSVLTETPMSRRSHRAFMRLIREEIPPLQMPLLLPLSQIASAEAGAVEAVTEGAAVVGFDDASSKGAAVEDFLNVAAPATPLLLLVPLLPLMLLLLLPLVLLLPPPVLLQLPLPLVPLLLQLSLLPLLLLLLLFLIPLLLPLIVPLLIPLLLPLLSTPSRLVPLPLALGRRKRPNKREHCCSTIVRAIRGTDTTNAGEEIPPKRENNRRRSMKEP